MTPVAPNFFIFFIHLSTENELEYVVENEVTTSAIRQELKGLAVVSWVSALHRPNATTELAKDLSLEPTFQRYGTDCS